jgi:apolipoprotein D and lipocalin family protein
MSIISSYIVLIVLISIIHVSQSQVPGFGRCPAVSIVQNFDVPRYMGLWYEVRKYPFIFQLGGSCTTAEYTLLADSTVKVVNTQVRNGAEDSVIGSATQVTPGVGSLTVTFPQAPCEYFL